MATRMFLRDTTANTAGYVGTELSTALPVGTLDDAGNGARDLETAKGAAQTSVANTSLAQTTHQDQYMGKWISDLLTVSAIDANTWTLAIMVQEAATGNNAFTVASIYVLKSDDTVRGYVYDSDTPLGVEWGGPGADGQVYSLTGSAVASVVSTDRLVVEIWAHAEQAMAAAAVNTLYFDGTTDVVGSTTTDAASYLETPQNDLFTASGVTGTVAVTQEAQTSAAAAVETFAATSAQTQADQTSTASGLVANPVTGTVGVTQADQTSTAAAVETFTATAAVSQADQTSAATGAESFTATAAVTQADQTSTATGVETIAGTSAQTQADQTSTASGVVGGAPTGTAAVTQDNQTSAASGVVAFIGTAAITQADQTSTAAAVETFTGTAAVTQAAQTSTASGLETFTATAGVTQTDQTSTASGNIFVNLTGTVAVTQENQFSTASGTAGVVTFWERDPAGFTRTPTPFTKTPVGFVRVGPDDDPPWD